MSNVDPNGVRGVDLIAIERKRQISEEGYDREGDYGYQIDMLFAAIEYARVGAHIMDSGLIPEGPTANWPWALEDYKPSEDAVRNLVKAGALLSASIDAYREGGKYVTVEGMGV